MTFEEQFPSLKNKRHINKMGEPPHYVIWFTEGQIQQHCLDKQKVKDAITKNGTHEGSNECSEPICLRILEELGLEK